MRRLLTYSLFFLLPLALHGQVMRKDIPDHPFLQLGKNEIHFPADSSSFDLVFRKLDSILFLGSGDLNILIIGDSHTQGGTFVKEVRNNRNPVPSVMVSEYLDRVEQVPWIGLPRLPAP